MKRTMKLIDGEWKWFPPFTEEELAGHRTRFNEMVQAGMPPTTKSDREFLHGHSNGNQFEKNPAAGDYYKAVAEAGGQNVKGKIYLSGLAEYPGDPRAWVSDRGDAQRVLEERGWGSTGMVEVSPAEREYRKPPTRPADDIIQAEVTAICDALPDGEHVDRSDLAQQVLEKRSRRV